MASKELVVLVVDIGLTMREPGGKLEDAQRAVRELVMQKLLHSKKDEVALVLFGSAATANPLEDKGYRHVQVVRPFETPGLGLLEGVDGLTGQGAAAADWIDALIVAMDLIITRCEAVPPKQRVPAKRIFLITDGLSTAETNDLPIVTEQLKQMAARLNVIGIGFDQHASSGSDSQPADDHISSTSNSSSSNPSSSSSSSRKRKNRAALDANQSMLEALVQQVEGGLYPVGEALEMLTQFYKRTVLQRTVFRGALEIGDSLALPLWSYVKTMPQKLPTMKKVSALTASDSGAPDEVQMDRSFASAEDPDLHLAREQLVKGFKYGNTILPFSAADEAALRYAAPKCLQLIGFTREDRVPPCYRLSQVEALVAPPGDDSAAVAVSALVQALHDSELVAIVRYVKRANGSPHLGALFPYVKHDYDCFLYCKLPFAEDVRQYPFAPLGRDARKPSFRPSEAQLAAAADLIDRFDLMHAHFRRKQGQEGEEDDEGERGTEAFDPRLTFNPVLQHFWQCVRTRALDPSAPLEKLDPVLMEYLRPVPELVAQAGDALAAFKELFPLHPAAESERAARQFWPEAAAVDEVILDSYLVAKKQKVHSSNSGPDDASSSADSATGSELISFDAFTANRVSAVGTITPAADFRAMCARRDVDLVDAALEQVQARVMHLVGDSIQGAFYPKAFEALQAMREVCVAEEEPDLFNAFLRRLKAAFKDQQRHDFWRGHVLHHRLSLISTSELPSSLVSPADALSFLDDDVPPPAAHAVEPSNSTKDDSEEDADDLLAQL